MNRKISEIEKFMSKMAMKEESAKDTYKRLTNGGLSKADAIDELKTEYGYSDDEISEIDAPAPKAEEPKSEEVKEDAVEEVVETPKDEETISDGDIENVETPNGEEVANSEEVDSNGNNPEEVEKAAQEKAEEATPQETEQAKQDFFTTWAGIKNRVQNVQVEFQKVAASAPKVTQNHKILDAVGKVGGVMASIGAVAGLVGTIMNFIPGMQGIGMALTAGGMALGGAGTALNRGSTGIKDIKDGNVKQGLMNLGMGAMGAMATASGVRGLTNQFGQAQVAQSPAPTNTDSGLVGDATVAEPQLPQTGEGAAEYIKGKTGGNLANWPQALAAQGESPETINQLRNTINNSSMGQTQMAMYNQANNAASTAQQFSNQANDLNNQAKDMNWFTRTFTNKDNNLLQQAQVANNNAATYNQQAQNLRNNANNMF